MNKAYPNKLNWQNTPSTSTPLGATNLNKMSDALDTIDDRVIVLDSDKVSKDGDKVLSDNNYTDEEKTKLNGIATGAEVNVQSNFEETDDTSDAFIVNNPFSVANGKINFTWNE